MHKDTRTGTICKPNSEKVPPATFDPLDYSSLVQISTKCAVGKKKPLFYGEEKKAKVESLTEDGAIAHAAFLFNGLMWLWATINTMTCFGIPASQDTLCVTLLDAGKHWVVIIAFNHYNLIDVPNSLREHKTFGPLVVGPDIIVEHDRDGKKHILYETLAPKTLAIYNERVVKSEKSPDKQRCLGSYPLKKRNDHHAEMRAWAYAQKRDYSIVWMSPTRPCCDKCRPSLEELDLLKFVPTVFRSELTESSKQLLQIEQHVFEGGDSVQFDGQEYVVQGVDNDGDCLFASMLEFESEGLVDLKLPGEKDAIQEIRNAVAAYQKDTMSDIIGQQHLKDLVVLGNWGTVDEDLHALGLMTCTRFVVHQVGWDGRKNQTAKVGAKANGGKTLHLLHQGGHFQPLLPVEAKPGEKKRKVEDDKEDLDSIDPETGAKRGKQEKKDKQEKKEQKEPQHA
jgi:hypothetical protein